MRKYKYENPNGAAGWLKRTNLVYFFLSWNAFGFCAYQWYKSKKNKDNPEWNKLTYAQKYLSLTMGPDDKITVMSMSGLSVKETKEQTFKEYTTSTIQQKSQQKENTE